MGMETGGANEGGVKDVVLLFPDPCDPGKPSLLGAKGKLSRPCFPDTVTPWAVMLRTVKPLATFAPVWTIVSPPLGMAI
jgi:hypothetical protein